MKAVPVVFLALLVPEIAAAHGSMNTAGAFNAGLLHPWLPAEQTMSLLAAGLIAGRYWGDRPAWVLTVLTAALAAGLFIPPSTFALSTISLCLLGFALTTGALVAVNVPVPRAAVLASAAIAGLFEGAASAPDADHWDVMTAFIAGSVLRAVFVFSVPFVVSDWLVREKGWHWARIGVRVVAAWMVAIALLMLALVLASP